MLLLCGHPQEFKHKGHILYEAFRVQKDPELRQKLYNECCSVVAQCPVPVDVATIPTLIVRPAPDLLKMTAEVRLGHVLCPCMLRR